MPASSRHALVVGAGVFGLAAALELGARGWRVTLVDRWGAAAPSPHPHASSTDVSKVIRMDYGADRFYTELAGEAMARWDEWNARFERPLLHRTGFLLLTRSPFAEGGFEEASFGLLRELGRPVRRVGPDELRSRFPAWNADRYPDGYLNPEAGWAESGAVVAELLRWTREAGVELRAGRVAEVGSGGSGPWVRVEDGAGRMAERVGCDLAVIATGTWSGRLLPGLASDVDTRAMPIVHIRPRDPDAFRPERFPVWGADIARTGWYGFPLHPDGFVKIGHHGRGWADDPDAAGDFPTGFDDRLRAFLSDSLPGLADGEIVHRRVCFYADSRDGGFWIDRLPGHPAIVVATGGSGHGFKFGPVLGELIANAAESTPDPRLEPLRWRPGAAPAREHARSDADVHR